MLFKYIKLYYLIMITNRKICLDYVVYVAVNVIVY